MRLQIVMAFRMAGRMHVERIRHMTLLTIGEYFTKPVIARIATSCGVEPRIFPVEWWRTWAARLCRVARLGSGVRWEADGGVTAVFRIAVLRGFRVAEGGGRSMASWKGTTILVSQWQVLVGSKWLIGGHPRRYSFIIRERAGVGSLRWIIVFSTVWLVQRSAAVGRMRLRGKSCRCG